MPPRQSPQGLDIYDANSKNREHLLSLSLQVTNHKLITLKLIMTGLHTL